MRPLIYIYVNILLWYLNFCNPGWQQEKIQGRKQRSPWWLECSRDSLAQTQAAQRVHHCGSLPRPVQIHCAVSDVSQEVPNLRGFHVSVLTTRILQQMHSAGMGDWGETAPAVQTSLWHFWCCFCSASIWRGWSAFCLICTDLKREQICIIINLHYF